MQDQHHVYIEIITRGDLLQQLVLIYHLNSSFGTICKSNYNIRDDTHGTDELLLSTETLRLV